MFGRTVPKAILDECGEPVRYWGARAIFKPCDKYPIDLLPDWQSCQCQEGIDPKPLLVWIDTVGLKKLQAQPGFGRLTVDSVEVVEFKDKQFTIQCGPQGSFGYLYIGAWQYWPKNCKYEQLAPQSGLKWSGNFEIPQIGDQIKAAINGEWSGVVVKYFSEHGYQGIEVDCSKGKVPDFYIKQGGNPKRVLLFGVDFKEVKPAPVAA